MQDFVQTADYTKDTVRTNYCKQWVIISKFLSKPFLTLENVL